MRTRRLAAAALVAAAAAAVPASAVADLPRGSEHVALDPADFSTRITNPWWPMRPGSRWVYRETDSEGARQRVVVRLPSQGDPSLRPYGAEHTMQGGPA